MRRRGSDPGFTLIELLIVVAIIGILAAIAIPNLMQAMQRSRQKRTMADIRVIASAWESRHVDTAGYLPAGQMTTLDFGATTTLTWAQMSTMLAPTYLREVPKTDAWGADLEYRTDNDFYYIRSGGKDKTFDGDTYTTFQTKYFECDIVYGNGQFLVIPEGVQLPAK